MNPLPFVTSDAAYALAFENTLSNTLGTVIAALAAPLSAVVVLWIIVQGILVMRGDIDTRKGVTHCIRIAVVYSLVVSAGFYTNTISNWFTKSVPSYIIENFGGSVSFSGVPAELDLILDVSQVEFNYIASQINSSNTQASNSLTFAENILFMTLWGAFAIYELVNIMTCILVAIGPIFIIFYLFDATRQIADRFVGQLVTYMVLLLLFNIVASVVLAADFSFVSARLLIFVVTGPISGQVDDFTDLVIFLLTGDFFIVSLPTIAGVIGGGLNSSRGESPASGFGGGRGRAYGAAPARSGLTPSQ